MDSFECSEGCYVCNTPLSRASRPSLLPCRHYAICQPCLLEAGPYISCGACLRCYAALSPSLELSQWQENLEVIQSVGFSERIGDYMREQMDLFQAWRWKQAPDIPRFTEAEWMETLSLAQLSIKEALIAASIPSALAIERTIGRFAGPLISEITAKSYSLPQDRHIYEEIHRLNRDLFGHSEFKEKQLEAITAVLSGFDVFISLPTGGGKSLCYQLPACLTPGLTIVIMPLLSLIWDQVGKVTELSIKNCSIFSGMSENDMKKSLEEPSLKLAFLTPEKLEKNTQTLSVLQQLHQSERLARIVVDEAHCVSQWGRSFRESYLWLQHLRTLFPSVPITALTATATEMVKADVCSILHLRDPAFIQASFDRPNLIYSVLPKTSTVLQEIALFIQKHPSETGIIYCNSQKETQTVSTTLSEDYQISISYYHAGLSDDERRKRESQWKAGEILVLASTVAFGMGIDKANVRFVIHYTFPMSLDCYAQETGRAGRDGLPSHCLLYYNPKDKSRKMFLLRTSIWDRQKKAGKSSADEGFGRQLTNLEVVCAYCQNTQQCRRTLMLDFFGEAFDRRLCAEKCDNCARNPAEMRDFTEQAKAAAAIIKETGSIRSLVDFLKAPPPLPPHLAKLIPLIQSLPEENLKSMTTQMIAKRVLQYKGDMQTYVLAHDVGYEQLERGDLRFEMPQKQAELVPEEEKIGGKGRFAENKRKGQGQRGADAARKGQKQPFQPSSNLLP